jgi:hypothetical protein
LLFSSKFPNGVSEIRPASRRGGGSKILRFEFFHQAKKFFFFFFRKVFHEPGADFKNVIIGAPKQLQRLLRDPNPLDPPVVAGVIFRLNFICR